MDKVELRSQALLRQLPAKMGQIIAMLAMLKKKYVAQNYRRLGYKYPP